MMPTEQQVVVTAALIVVVGLVAMFLGRWWGVGQGRDQGYEERVKEEEAEAREQAKARRTHPVYRQPPEVAHDGRLPRWDPQTEPGPWLAPEEMFPWAGSSNRAAAITTGEIQAITDETDIMVARWKADNDLWMAEHGLSDS